MPIARFEMPDGRIARYEVPEGTTPEQAQRMISQQISNDSIGQMDPVSTKDAFLIGAGRSADKLIQGVKQLAGKADPEREKSNDEVYANLQRQHPIATSLGEALPSAAVPVSLGVLPAAAAMGAIEAGKYGTVDERAARGALASVSGAAAGYGAKALSKLVSPVAKDAVSGTEKAALQGVQDIGVKPRLSQVTGSPAIARLEDYAASVPGGAGVMRDFAQANQKVINKAAAESIGQVADDLSPSVFAEANKQLGRVFQEVKTLPGRPIKLDSSVASAADAILNVQAKLPPEMKSKEIISLASRAKSMAQMNARIDGEAYQLIRSNLSDAAQGAFSSSNSTVGKAYQSMLRALDDSAEQSLKGIGKSDLAQAIREVRPMYANLKVLEKGAVSENGNVSVARLASALRSQNPAAFREGRNASNPLSVLARYGETKPALQAGSQTFPREAVSNPVSMLMNAMWSYPLAKATTSPLVTGYAQNVADTEAVRALAALMEPASRGALMTAIGSPFEFMK